jgi:hypothetical protein
MRRTLACLLACLMLVAACTEEPPPENPPLDGFYRELMWACSGACQVNPAVLDATTLEIRGRSLKFTNEEGLVVYHGATDFLDGCLWVTEGEPETIPSGTTITRRPYEMCGEHPAANAAITWAPTPNGAASTYQLHARFR